jgi:beta-galactosidase/beta-glucuronidase
MPNRILDIQVWNHRLDPVETELRIAVELQALDPTTEIRGRLVGPRCPYASTVEIAYPLREVQREQNKIIARVVIPEPSWWDPQSPFLYQGPLELWEEGTLCERQMLSRGIRNLQLTTKGIRLNGRPFTLLGKTVPPNLTEADVRQFHDVGINTILTTFHTEPEWLNSKLWRLADQFGLFVLSRAADNCDGIPLSWIQELYPSALGCILQGEDGEEERIREILDERQGSRPWFGALAGSSVPSIANFVLCREEELTTLSGTALPKLVLVKRLPEPVQVRPDVIGWIESAAAPECS